MAGSRHVTLAVRCLYLPLLFTLSVAVAQPSATPLDTESLASFFDEAVPPLLAEYRVPGVVLAVVADGGVQLAQGYGVAQLEPERPVTADTPFATGSVAKLFVWTAVMQLVEQGALGLETDVNEYLDFQIPATYSQPITLRHLLTHTPGFEDRPVIGLFSYNAERLRDLRAALIRHLPARVRAPGEESAYSNYGSALAAYIVERVSGVPYDAYVEAQILAPLGMTSSSLRRKLPAELATAAAVGYQPDGEGGYQARGREYMELYPAGAMVMSARDAAQFMLTYLGDGTGEAGRILQPETVARMRETLFSNVPDLPGNAYGFWESARHGERILGHGGDTIWIHTQLALLPERGIGFYLATNSSGGGALRRDVWEAFLDRFFPVPPVATAREEASLTRYAGLYGSNRASRTTAGKILTLFTPLAVRVENDALATSAGGERRWLPQGGGVFADADYEGERLLFREDAGRMTLHVSSGPMEVFRRLRWFELPIVHAALLGGAVLLLLSGVIGLPLGAWLARRRGAARSPATTRSRWLVVAAAGLLLVAVLVSIPAMVDPMGPAFGAPPLLLVALALGLVGVVAGGALVLITGLAWLLGWWGAATRVHVGLVTLAGVVLLLQLNYWNLIGFKL